MDINNSSDITGQESELYGGWLRFFKIANVIFLTFLPLNILFSVVTVFIDPEEDIFSIEYGLFYLQVLPDFIFSILILKIIKNRDKSTPDYISKLMGFDLLSKVLITILVLVVHKNGIVEDKPYPLILSIIYYLIWSSYFSNSKRVFGFYNKNPE